MFRIIIDCFSENFVEFNVNRRSLTFSVDALEKWTTDSYDGRAVIINGIEAMMERKVEWPDRTEFIMGESFKFAAYALWGRLVQMRIQSAEMFRLNIQNDSNMLRMTPWVA